VMSEMKPEVLLRIGATWLRDNSPVLDRFLGRTPMVMGGANPPRLLTDFLAVSSTDLFILALITNEYLITNE